MASNRKTVKNSVIRPINLRSPSNPLLKSNLVFKHNSPYIRSFRTISKPTHVSIFVKGSQTPSFDPSSSVKIKPRSTCLVRDAIQNKEWLCKARENITQELGNFINSSNCLTIDPPSGPVVYKYFLGKGNNSGLIKKCLSTRPWWVPVNEDQAKSANFVWAQFKFPEHFASIPVAYERIKIENPYFQDKSLTCSALYEDITNTLKSVDISSLGYDLITKSRHFISFQSNFRIDPCTAKIQNKLEFHYNLSDKKLLYKNMKEYYEGIERNVFEYLPLTFHIGKHGKNLDFFVNAYNAGAAKGLWIVKPGENANRGTGIFVSNDLNKIISEISSNQLSGSHTYIIQKYIEKPFLINKRKFDIRLYTLVTSVNGVIQAYFYQEGYLRTTCKPYTPNDLDNNFIHLTNDAVQNKCEDYGKYENGNKLSYHDFQKYLDSKKIPVNFQVEIMPKIKQIVADTICATVQKLNENRKLLSFEVIFN